MLQITEQCLVALALSGVVRLQQEFEAAASSAHRHALLLAAADVLDRTLPYPDLKESLASAGAQQVPALILGRARIGAVPHSLWRPARIQPRDLPTAPARGLRALELVMRKDAGTSPTRTRENLEQWLAPAWAQYPELAVDCQALADLLS